MEEKKINKPANFISRLSSVFINSFIIILIVTPLSLIAIDNKNGELILNNILYYVWLLLFILVLFIYFFIIPLFFKGRNIGELIFLIKPINDNLEGKNNFSSLLFLIFKKNFTGSFLWIFILLCFISFVPPSSAQKLFILQNDQTSNEMTTLEIMGISIPAILSPLVIIINLFSLVSISINKNYQGFFDKLNNIKYIFINKFEKIDLVSSKDIFPEKKEEIQINWKE
ncbi:MAG: hypothetical protein ACRDBR_01475 [Metamycoplasmataceae bacterium]